MSLQTQGPEPVSTCRCWRLPREDGSTVSVGALAHHGVVTVLTNSQPVRGRVLGACWAGPPSQPERYLIVREDDGSHRATAVAECELRAVVPTGDVESASVDDALVGLVRSVEAVTDWDHVEVWTDLSEERGVWAQLRLVPHRCQPSEQEPPPEASSARGSAVSTSVDTSPTSDA